MNLPARRGGGWPVIIPVLLLSAGAVINTGCRINLDREHKDAIEKSAQPAAMVQAKSSGSKTGADDDAAHIVYVSMVSRHAQIHTISPQGREPFRVTGDQGYKCRPVWSPDHKRIAFFYYETDRPVGHAVLVKVMQADGFSLRTIVSHKRINTREARISWKPDGEVIYFQEKDFPGILFGYQVATGKPVETIRIPKHSFLTEIHTLSPNMEYIAGAGQEPKAGLRHIGTIHRDGTRETDLLKPFGLIPLHVGTAVWSYDSQWVAFEYDTVIIVMPSELRLDFKAYHLASQSIGAQLSAPAFSPSGKLVAGVMEQVRKETAGTGEQEVISDIWVMKIDGTGQRQITHTGSCFDPHW